MLLFAGGEPGHVGRNLLIKNGGTIINLGAKVSVDVQPGVCNSLSFVIRMPELFHEGYRVHTYTITCQAWDQI